MESELEEIILPEIKLKLYDFCEEHSIIEMILIYMEDANDLDVICNISPKITISKRYSICQDKSKFTDLRYDERQKILKKYNIYPLLLSELEKELIQIKENMKKLNIKNVKIIQNEFIEYNMIYYKHYEFI